MTDLDTLVQEWLPLPDVAERIGTDVGSVRRMVQEGRLLAVRRGERNVLSVPADFLVPTGDEGRWQVVPALAGTLTLLADAGFTTEEAVRWLFRPDATLEALGTGATRPRTPVEALAAGHKTEIRRRAQAEAL
ncbi:Rv2175c family DNA-binding protein [Actinotalea sp. AC32]|nr:Rv2175c family DNA-binding protein [Actinotalea sp. AC32]